jgi:hypothetical protein
VIAKRCIECGYSPSGDDAGHVREGFRDSGAAC